MMSGGMLDGYGFGLIGLVLNVAIVVGIVVLVVWVVKRFTTGSAKRNQPSSNQPRRKILQERYARGEITREQYQQILQNLG